ncbi:MAG: FAD/NAD(P)-binding protein [Isosphaeraceae bacterium]
MSSNDPGPVIAIIGGGFSGAMVAVHLATRGGPRRPRLALFEKSERFARGLAYGTKCDRHLLNVAAGMMSALPDQPSHFLDWLRDRDPEAHAGTFAPRRVYGDYLEDLLMKVGRDSGTRIDLIRDEVLDMAPVTPEGPLRLTTRSGRHLVADRTVLALGNPLPTDPGGTAPGKLPGYRANPWAADVLDGLSPEESILLIGSGLTAVDLVVEACERGHLGTIHTVSRHGLLPCGHRPVAPRPHFHLAAQRSTARGLLRSVRQEAAVCREEGGDWRSVIDALRPDLPNLWKSMDVPERARFLRHVAPRWDVHRHRVAPEIEDLLENRRRQGQLQMTAGRVLDLIPSHGRIGVRIRPRGEDRTVQVEADRVINCTGPSKDFRRGGPPLLASLIARGIARPGPLALGLDVLDSGAVDGPASDRLFAIGPIRKESLWETTAVRELRTQAQDLARLLLA